jgi:hypothetical protein
MQATEDWSEVGDWQKNNTRDSNVVPHRSTNLARPCLTSLSRREAVLSCEKIRSIDSRTKVPTGDG